MPICTSTNCRYRTNSHDLKVSTTHQLLEQIFIVVQVELVSSFTWLQPALCQFIINFFSFLPSFLTLRSFYANLTLVHYISSQPLLSSSSYRTPTAALTGEEIGLCALITSTNIQSKIPAWNCTNVASKCSSPVWTGLTCSAGQVISLSLNSQSLTGSIPSTISTLTGLTNLYLGYNSLTGPIPSSLGEMTKLSFLHIYANRLTGSLPSTLSTLTGVTFLALGGSTLVGPIPSLLLSILPKFHRPPTLH
jgi:hypothetical protein